MKRNEPPRQLDDTRALGLRGVNATEDGEYSTHGVSLSLSLSESIDCRGRGTKKKKVTTEAAELDGFGFSFLYKYKIRSGPLDSDNVSKIPNLSSLNITRVCRIRSTRPLF